MFRIDETPPYSLIDLNIIYGNTHILMDPRQYKILDQANNKKQPVYAHRWIMFVYLDDGKKDLTDKVIKDVTYNIKHVDDDDRKEQKKVTVTSQPFLLSRPGNKLLTIKINVTFKKWTKLLPHSFTHQLCFEGDGSSGNKVRKIGVPSETYI